jgi:hypothetical protein
MGVENIKVEAMKVVYGIDTAQKEKITIRAGIAKASLAGKYFHMYATTLAGVISKHVFWFNTTGTDTAPVLADATLHEVDISAGAIDTIAEIATELASVISAVAGVYSAISSNNVVEVSHSVVGYAPTAHDAKAALLKTNFGFEILVQGDREDELGCIEGDIEVAFEESFIDVTCHAEGTTPVAQLKNGVSSVEVTLNLQETTKEKLKKMFVKSGGSFTPDNGTEVFGMGTFKNFENMFKYATKLRLHPVRLLDGDRGEDYTFHKAIPNLKGLTFSGENVFTLPITFKVYPAENIDSRVNYFSIGDGSQSLV